MGFVSQAEVESVLLVALPRGEVGSVSLVEACFWQEMGHLPLQIC